MAAGEVRGCAGPGRALAFRVACQLLLQCRGVMPGAGQAQGEAPLARLIDLPSGLGFVALHPSPDLGILQPVVASVSCRLKTKPGL